MATSKIMALLKSNGYNVQDIECCSTCEYVFLAYDGLPFCSNEINQIKTDDYPYPTYSTDVSELGVCDLFRRAL